MKLSRRLLARHIATELQSGKNRKDVVTALAAYVIEHRLHSQLELILADVAANLAELGHIEATVTTARPLTDELRTEVLEYVRRIEGSKDITLNETVDPFQDLLFLRIRNPRRHVQFVPLIIICGVGCFG